MSRRKDKLNFERYYLSMYNHYTVGHDKLNKNIDELKQLGLIYDDEFKCWFLAGLHELYLKYNNTVMPFKKGKYRNFRNNYDW